MVPIPGIGPGTSPLPRECSATEPNGHFFTKPLRCGVLVKKSVNQTTVNINRANLERGRRIELLALAWKAKVLPLYEPRTVLLYLPQLLLFSAIFAGGEGWIRTSVLVRGQIYSLLPLTTRPPLL